MDFWAEIYPSDHLVQIYEDDQTFLDSLEGFVAGGILAGDGVVTIATEPHRKALDDRLSARGVDIVGARARDQYISLDAEESLAKFMVGGWPDEAKFLTFVTELLDRATGEGRRVRAFGEMVAVLWGRGHNGATVQLEHLWHRLCEQQALSLFCAYPRIGFTQNASTSIREICEIHSKLVAPSVTM